VRVDVTCPTVLIVPGLRDHVDDHWQTLLAARLERVRTVPPFIHELRSFQFQVQKQRHWPPTAASAFVRSINDAAGGHRVR